MPNQNLEKLSVAELLETNGLNRKEIIQRVEIIELRILDHQILKPEEITKYQKIKTKLKVALENDKKIGTYFYSLSPQIINTKYLSQNALERFREFILDDPNHQKNNKDQVLTRAQDYQPSRKSNFSEIDEITTEKSFRYNDNKYFVESYNDMGIYDFNLEFKDKKCIIKFEIVMPRLSPLYPEEFQVKLIENMTKAYPELREKFANIEELNIEHCKVTNHSSLDLVGKHIVNPKQLYPATESASTINFPKTPNTNNIMNFVRKFKESFFQDFDFKFEKAKTRIEIGEKNLIIIFKFSKRPSSVFSPSNAMNALKTAHQISKL
ncbi:hypothetical protein LBMAG18_09320 [Alphaproteobacteria bacterium]|nr:hypothetical protein LBMAG18_09320 [Alphaproteobacteria bacterium]